MNLIDSATLIRAPKFRNMVSASKLDNPGHVKRVAVIGAGVSGLSAAYKLKSRGFDVTVFEASGGVGGKLRSVSHNGLIWDEGANTMTESEIEVQTLLDDLGLREKQQIPISQNKRYIVKNGLPVMLPANPIDLIKSNILSSQSKFQLLLEPFLWKKRNSNSKISDENTQSESVRGFFQRHFGNEVVDYLIDPFVAGTSGGDPDSLSMEHSFPELWNLEDRFGSIIAGAIQSKFLTEKDKRKLSSEKKKRLRGSFSFQNGMQTLPETLSKELEKDKLKLNSRILSLAYGCRNDDDELAIGKWAISSSNPDNSLQDLAVDAVIMTAPLGNVKEMKITTRGTLFPLNFLPEVTYLPLSVIITTFNKHDVKRPLEGFGVLVPSSEQNKGLQTLGTLFSSMMFPDRAPNDQYMYTTFVGGSRNKELASASTDELKQVVTSDLRQLLGAEGEPTFVNHVYWKKAFPLYGHDYGSVISAIETMEKSLPGFFYAGNHKGGLSVGKSIASGCKAAELAIAYLDSS